MLRNFVDIIGIADPSSFPTLLPTSPNTEYIVEEKLTIPQEKPDVEQINTVLIEAKVTDSRVIPTPVGLKIVVDGELKQKIIYTANVPEQSVHSVLYVEPFCTFIEVPLKLPAGTNTLQLLQTLGITLNDVLVGKPNVLIEDVTVSLLDPRTIEKCTVLFIWATLNSALSSVLG